MSPQAAQLPAFARSSRPASRRRWVRVCPLNATASHVVETWQCHDRGRIVGSFDVEVTVGKPFDVVGLKRARIEEIKSYADFLRRTARRLYGTGARLVPVARCPCCAADTSEASAITTVFGATYRRCADCDHVFVSPQPAPSALQQLFAESEEHAAAYTDGEAVDLRLREVVKPKLDWTMEVFRRHCGRPLCTAADVGAGGGHFVEQCRRAGISARGHEPSARARRFARERFGLELSASDFLVEEDVRPVDVVTFWGLLEYVAEPRSFLQAAHRTLAPASGLLVVEVPRFDCLGTAVQQLRPDTVARHLDPTSHLNCFTETSLAAALLETGFRPVAAWYFGMDAYELLVQLAIVDGDDRLVDQAAFLLGGLQAALDAARACDDLVVAAVPLDRAHGHG